jgi:hypothetical protein
MPQWDSLSLYNDVRGCREEAISATVSSITSRAFFTEFAHDATPGSASTWFSGCDDKSSGRTGGVIAAISNVPIRATFMTNLSIFCLPVL